MTARHKSLNQLRARTRDVGIVDAASQAVGRIAVPGPAEVAEASALQRYVDELVAALAPIDAEIFHLCIDRGLSYARAAAALNVTPGVVRNRLSRLRQRLRAGVTSFGEK